MKIKQLSAYMVSGLALGVSSVHAEPFAFQGQLNDEGTPANGMYDLEFALFGIDTGGMQIGSTIRLEDQIVTNGNFSVELDFGDVFDGTSRWIEISVRNGDSIDAYNDLAPRLKIGNSPQANYASKAGVADSLSDPFWVNPAPGILQIGEQNGNDQIFVNFDRAIESTDVMVVHSAANAPGGITVSTWTNGMPYYGYASGGFARAKTYYDPITDAWVVNKDGDQLEIDTDNNVIITNDLIVGGSITSLSGPSPTMGYKSYTPETIFAGFGTSMVFHGFAGAIVTQGSSSYLRADFDLPHGAIVNSIRIEYVDNTSNNMRVQLWRRDLGTLAFTSETLGETSGAIANTVQVLNIVPATELVIDNTECTYDLRVFATNAAWPSNGLMGIRSILVGYTAP